MCKIQLDLPVHDVHIFLGSFHPLTSFVSQVYGFRVVSIYDVHIIFGFFGQLPPSLSAKFKVSFDTPSPTEWTSLIKSPLFGIFVRTFGSFPLCVNVIYEIPLTQFVWMVHLHLYRVVHLARWLGWVDFDLGCSTLCLVLLGRTG